jgi:phosphoglycerate dehydrogenase-like enzyme
LDTLASPSSKAALWASFGLGALGSRVAGLARPFGMRLLASTFGLDQGRAAVHGPSTCPSSSSRARPTSSALHLRLSADTQGYLGKARLAMMKPTAFLINTARGGLVDKPALIDALRDKRLAGAALDVFHEEPIPPGDPLLALPELVLTPHNRGMTCEVIDNGVLRPVEDIQLFLDGRARDRGGAAARAIAVRRGFSRGTGSGHPVRTKTSSGTLRACAAAQRQDKNTLDRVTDGCAPLVTAIPVNFATVAVQ